jgi:hypothetical protein
MTEQQIKDLDEAVVNLDEAVHDNEDHLKALTVLYKNLEEELYSLKHRVRVLENKA